MKFGQLSFFPTPYPDEDFRSVLYRYHLVTLHKEMSETSRELFGVRSNFTVFPRSINKLLDKLPAFSKYSMQSFIDQHTLLPIFLPFIVQSHREKILNEVANGGDLRESRVGKLVGNKYGKCISDKIKYCPYCIKEDNNLYGCSYIHREHQFFFINRCVKHKVKLISYCMVCGTELKYSPLHFMCTNGHQICNSSVGSVIEDLFENEIQRDLEYILQNSEKLNDTIMRRRFLQYLSFRGYMRGESIRCQEFANDFINCYTEKKLSELGFNIDYLHKHNTYENIFRSEKLVINVLLVLLITRFLGGTFEKFMGDTLNLSVEIPFGHGPWECKNKYCPKYRKALITYCERKNCKARGYSGKFYCEFCSTTYIKLWIPDKGAKEGRVIFASNEKINERIISLLKDGLTHEVISTKVYRSKQLVQKVAREYSKAIRPLYQCEVACSMEEGFLDAEDLKKMSFREKLKSVMFEHQDLSRNQISQKCSNTYKWLQKNDREWLEENLPPSKLSEELRLNWPEIDEVLAVRVREVSIQLKDGNYKSRVAVQTIMNALSKEDRGRLKNNLKDLPKAAKALQACSETKEQYQTRYLPSIVQQLRNYYGYKEVSIEVVQSYRRSYRDITENLKQRLTEELLILNSHY